MYELGRGVDRDYDTALKWYRRAADQKFAAAEFSVGWMYRKGKSVDKNDETAVMWYRRAAEQGYPKAQFNLGVMYFSGRGVEKNKVFAYMWAHLAALKGNKYGAEVQHHLTKQMPRADIATARKLAQDCIRRKYKEC
jgi:hypothetical protein